LYSSLEVLEQVRATKDGSSSRRSNIGSRQACSRSDRPAPPPAPPPLRRHLFIRFAGPGGGRLAPPAEPTRARVLGPSVLLRSR
jgi:hypothetical protein